MELNELMPLIVTLVMVGILLAIGIIVTEKFADAARTSVTITNESFIMPAGNATVTLDNGNITTFTQVLNTTDGVCDATAYSVALSTGVITNTGQPTGCTNGTTLFAYYTYDEYDTAAATSLKATRDSLGDISNDWFGIIVIVAICALILFMVVRAFNMSGRQ